MFVGIFAYCLVVLRTIRGGDEGAFVPSLAVLAGLVLAFVGIAFLIYFIHHISMSIQASSIIAAAAQETIAAVDHLFPKELGEDADEDAGRQPLRRLLRISLGLPSRPGRPVTSRVSTRTRSWMWPGNTGPSCGWNAASGSLSSRARRWSRWSTRRTGRRDDRRAERGLCHQPSAHGGTGCRVRHPADRGHRHESTVARHQRHHDRSDVRGLPGGDPGPACGPSDCDLPPAWIRGSCG